MAGLLKSILVTVRFLLVAMFIFVNWATLSALFQGDITFAESVDALFSNIGLVALVIIIVLSFAISFLSNTAVRWAVNIITVLVLYGLISGTISLNDIQQTVQAHIDINSVQDTVSPCNWYGVVEDNGDEIRTFLKNDEGKVIGEVVHVENGQTKVIDTAGELLKCNA